MNSTEYNRLCSLLKSKKDIKRVSREKGLDEELLLVILSQKIVRNTKKDYYELKRKLNTLLGVWMHGKKFTEIAQDEGFPPLLTASLMLQHTGVSKKQFRSYVENPSSIEDKRLRQDLKEAIDEELIYSPEGARIQHGRGKEVELMLKKWLDGRGIRYVTEYEAKKGEHTKTPDFNLQSPIQIRKKYINWIECKGSFADESEYKRDYGKQLMHYVNLFGPGAVVYWYGYIEDMPNHLMSEDIMLLDQTYFKK